MKEVVIVCALIRNYENKLFLMSSSKWKGYGLPGGKPRDNEIEEETLMREVREEIGIEITDLVKAAEIILPPTDKIDGATTFIVKPYYARTIQVEVRPNKEVGEYGWYSIEDALKLELLGPIRKTIEVYRKNFN